MKFHNLVYRLVLGLLLTVVFQVQAAVDFTRVAGSESPGVIITGEIPECWFSPIDYDIQPSATVAPTGVVKNSDSEIIEYFAESTQNGLAFKTHVYQAVYDIKGRIIAYQEDRTFATSSNTYHITLSNVAYDASGNVLDGYPVTITVSNPVGFWNDGELSSPSFTNGVISDWQFLLNKTTRGNWTIYNAGSIITSANASGTFTLDSGGQLDATYTGTASEVGTVNSTTYTLTITKGVIDPAKLNTITGTFEIDFDPIPAIGWTTISYEGDWSATRYLPNLATSPKPANAASPIRSNTKLNWKAGLDASSHDVYFGTDPNLDPNTSFRGNQVETTFNPGRLELSTIYYWRIDEKNVNGTTPGTRWSFTVIDSPLTVGKCTVTALNGYAAVEEPRFGSLSFSGFFDATQDDFLAADADEVVITVDANELCDPDNCVWTFPINEFSFKKGKFSYTNKEKGGSCQSTFKLDTKTSKITFSAKNMDLTGLACPMTITIRIGSYSEQIMLDEVIVNGARKLSPIKLMMGVKDTLTVIPKVKFGTKSDTDSFTAQGTFTIANNYDKSQPLVVTLGTQTFAIPGGNFIPKNGSIESYKTTSPAIPVITATLNFAKCTYSISIKKAEITDRGAVDFGIHCFGVGLEGSEPIILE
jgi:hypothetical protein